MRSDRGRILTALLLACGLPVAAQAPPSPPPRDPGAVVLLAETEGHAADEDLRQALLDPDPRTRRIAARVLAAGNHRELLGYVIGALLREQDADTGAELLRDALYLGGERDLSLIDRQAARLGRRAMEARTEWLARTQPEQFAAAVPALAAGEAAAVLPTLIDMTAIQHPKLREPLFDSWMAVAGKGDWSDLLNLAYAPPVPIEPAAAILERALSSNRASVREETVWFLVAALRDERKVPAPVLEAAVPVEGTDASEWERFGRELIARSHKKARTPDRSAAITRADKSVRVGRLLSGLPVLTQGERDALVQRDASRPVTLSYWRTHDLLPRTIELPAPGVVAATLAAAGCKSTGELGQAAVAYWPDGRPKTIRVGAGRLPSACVKALTALSRLSFAESGSPISEAAQVMVLPFHASFLACSVAVDTPSPSGDFSNAVITTPRKLRDMKPDYPQQAIRDRVQGVVIVEAVISRRGCTQSARVVRSIPALDAAALWAVTQWLYEPALLDGAPVPVVMNVTVNFQLQ